MEDRLRHRRRQELRETPVSHPDQIKALIRHPAWPDLKRHLVLLLDDRMEVLMRGNIKLVEGARAETVLLTELVDNLEERLLDDARDRHEER